MKKKILALCLVVVLVATAITGVTLAYFTDTDIETNTFTIGNVEIDLEENYEQNSELMPNIDVTKEAWITNTGANDAWVWAEILIPAALDDNDDHSPAAPGLGNSLHFNFPAKYSVEYNGKKPEWNNNGEGKLWQHQYNADGIHYGYVGTEEIGGVAYNKFIAFYTEELAPKASTSNFMSKVYMDAKVEQCKDTTHTDCMKLADGTTCYTGPWEIIVRGYAIQAEGFEDVISAWKAFDGDKPAIDREQTPDNGPAVPENTESVEEEGNDF